MCLVPQDIKPPLGLGLQSSVDSYFQPRVLPDRISFIKQGQYGCSVRVSPQRALGEKACGMGVGVSVCMHEPVCGCYDLPI